MWIGAIPIGLRELCCKPICESDLTFACAWAEVAAQSKCRYERHSPPSPGRLKLASKIGVRGNDPSGFDVKEATNISPRSFLAIVLGLALQNTLGMSFRAISER
jgi:hypothetical protein